MAVNWTQPEDDGGARAGFPWYVIKYGDTYTRVDDYATLYVDGYRTYFQFTDELKEETRYQFAVAAKNAAGRGEFSEFSDYVYTGRGKQCYD